MADIKIGQVQSQQVALGKQIQGKKSLSGIGMDAGVNMNLNRGMSSAIKNLFALPAPDFSDDTDITTTARGAMKKMNQDLTAGGHAEGEFDFASMFAASAQMAGNGVDEALQGLRNTGVVDGNDFEERSKLAAVQQQAQQFQDRLGALLNNKELLGKNENTSAQIAEKFNQLLPNTNVVGLKGMGDGPESDTAKKMMAISCMISSRGLSVTPGAAGGQASVNPSALLFKAQQLFNDKAIMGQSLNAQMNQPLSAAAGQMFGRGGATPTPGRGGSTPISE